MDKLKATMLGVFVALAMSAGLTATASAKYDSEVSAPNLSGLSENSQTVQTKFGNVVCSSATFHGFPTGTGVGGGVYTSQHTTLHPTYTECKALGFNATIDTSGCDFTFTTPTATEVTGPHASVDLVGVFCDINIVAAGGLCSINIPEQTEMGLAFFMNEGSGSTRDITVDMSLNSIDYEGVGGFCSGSGSAGAYFGSMTLRAFSGGKQVGIWVTNT